MKHVFLIKPVEDTYDTHPFVPVIKEIMKDYDYEIHFSAYKIMSVRLLPSIQKKPAFTVSAATAFLIRSFRL